MTTTLDATGTPAVHTGELRMLNESGDIKIVWDKDNADEVAAAKAVFDDLVGKKKHLAYSVKGRDGNKDRVIREFDPSAERIIIAPQLVGG